MMGNSTTTILRRAISALLLLSLAAILTLQEARPSQRNISPATQSPTNLLIRHRRRVVHFPANRSLGSLQITDVSSNREKNVLDFGQAKGSAPDIKRLDRLREAYSDVQTAVEKASAGSLDEPSVRQGECKHPTRSFSTN